MNVRARLAVLARRLAAAGYDGLVMIALWIFATATLMPFTDGAINPPLPYNIPFDLYILAITFAYFGWFWTHGGQTLGMKAWKYEVTELDGSPLRWPGAARRFLLAGISWLLLGAGWLWLLFDREQLTLHDRYSNTRIQRIDKSKGTGN